MANFRICGVTGILLSIAPYWNWNFFVWWVVRFEIYFQSHHTGIEIGYRLNYTGGCHPFNRTILELKFQFTYQGNALIAAAFNRTILELKFQSACKVRPVPLLSIAPYWNWNEWLPVTLLFECCFQSHHTGIEMCCKHTRAFLRPRFQSHHTGIEILLGTPMPKRLLHSFNRTILELKCEVMWSVHCSNLPFNRTILELK